MNYVVDLNSDIGESFGVYKIGLDEEVVKQISSANIACGFHAGDPTVINDTVEKAVKNDVAVGAHPGFPDLAGFGRRKMDISPHDITQLIVYQIGAIAAFAKKHGACLQHVKAHGALYNMAAKDRQLADAIAKGIAQVDKNLICVGQANTEMEKSAKKYGLKYACEVFADRNMNPDGSLVSRKLANAVITDEELACKRVLRMVKEGEVEAIDGSIVKVKADTICVHGDNPKAVKFTSNIRKTLIENDVEIKPMSNFIQ